MQRVERMRERAASRAALGEGELGACERSWIVRLAHRWRFAVAGYHGTIGRRDSDVKSILSTYSIELDYYKPGPAAVSPADDASAAMAAV